MADVVASNLESRMEKQKIIECFTTDHHFNQAEFDRLLKQGN